MTKRNQIYKCEYCGIVASIVQTGGGQMICCGSPMILMKEKTAEQEGKEKHVPIIKIEGKTVTVKVGSIPHPMKENHFIGLIQLMQNGKVIMGKTLNSEDKPKAVFCNVENTDNLSARGLCNLHGLWKS